MSGLHPVHTCSVVAAFPGRCLKQFGPQQIKCSVPSPGAISGWGDAQKNCAEEVDLLRNPSLYTPSLPLCGSCLAPVLGDPPWRRSVEQQCPPMVSIGKWPSLPSAVSLGPGVTSLSSFLHERRPATDSKPPCLGNLSVPIKGGVQRALRNAFVMSGVHPQQLHLVVMSKGK